MFVISFKQSHYFDLFTQMQKNNLNSLKFSEFYFCITIIIVTYRKYKVKQFEFYTSYLRGHII